MTILGLQLRVVVLATIAASYRLPTTVLPSAYEVHLTIPEDAFTDTSDSYAGHVIITLRASQPGVSQIQLHAAHDFINITSALYNNSTITSISVDNDTDIVTFGGLGGNVSTTVNAVLYINFNSKLSTIDMYGLYKSSYAVGGSARYLATTQFQPTYARRAFPCFDEPAFKATFEIYITHPSRLTTLSNMPGEPYNASDDVGANPNLTTTHFPAGGVMPTYLVAFIVSDFTCSSGESIEANAVPYRVCSTALTSSSRAFALQSGVRLLRSLNAFTNYSYGSMGFPKMDQVAIPDFAAGAMENWGLVTYRERLLLWDPVESTNADQQSIATVISHEFAHQWWGNLVTMDWWSETFLNEGFATYFEYFTTHDVFPEWELDKQWVVRVAQGVLESDSFSSSQALQAPANSDVDVMSRFSPISYLKGGSVFRMVEHILGTENFVKGLGSYLQKHAFQNTIPDDLWTSLDEQLTDADRSRLPRNTSLNEVMRSWVESPGYPILDVQSVAFAIVIRQEGRFLLNGNDTTARWFVPITYATDQNPDFEDTAAKQWLLPLGFVEVPFLNSPRWIVLNNHATGYYRVNYNGLWDNIIVALRGGNFSGIPDVNRASFVDDAFHLARSNRLNYTRVFGIVDFLRNDTSHHAWFPAINGFNYLLRRVGQDSRLGRSMSNHVLELLANIYASVPWLVLNSNNHAYTMKQVDVLTVACRLGLPNCVNHALERFGEFKIQRIRPTSNLRSIVYCNALRYGNNVDDWGLLWSAYQSTNVASERVRILSALGCTQNRELLEQYLQMSLDEDSGIRPQDAISVFTSVYSGSSVGISVAFKFLRENHVMISQRYQSMNALRNMITGLAERFTTESELNELRNFVQTDDLDEDFLSAANSALASAESNSAWLSQHWHELHYHYGLDPDAADTETSSATAPTTNGTQPPTDPPAVSTLPPSTTAPGGGVGVIQVSVALMALSIVLALRS